MLTEGARETELPKAIAMKMALPSHSWASPAAIPQDATSFMEVSIWEKSCFIILPPYKPHISIFFFDLWKTV